ncbi:MAG: DUF2520 domain-containing protein [Bacteroidaceae bacterium]|nr:DUF2520 domain-containing protein [Bacteroidaceae bacterium]
MVITLVGAGNLATCLGYALLTAGHTVRQVWSRTTASAETLGKLLQCPWTTDLQALSADTDLFVVSVKDSALHEVAAQLPRHALVVHTAGSMPLDTLTQPRRGVFYPMQTFSKTHLVDFRQIPIFVEAAAPDDEATLTDLAQSVSTQVRPLSSERRKFLHVAAVFACNMTNHCYQLAAEVLAEQDIPFEAMLPLIDETANKVHTLSPHTAQTGPAVRWDKNVMERHLQMLDEEKREIYRMMSESIHKRQ